MKGLSHIKNYATHSFYRDFTSFLVTQGRFTSLQIQKSLPPTLVAQLNGSRVIDRIRMLEHMGYTKRVGKISRKGQRSGRPYVIWVCERVYGSRPNNHTIEAQTPLTTEEQTMTTVRIPPPDVMPRKEPDVPFPPVRPIEPDVQPRPPTHVFKTVKVTYDSHYRKVLIEGDDMILEFLNSNVDFKCR